MNSPLPKRIFFLSILYISSFHEPVWSMEPREEKKSPCSISERTRGQRRSYSEGSDTHESVSSKRTCNSSSFEETSFASDSDTDLTLLIPLHELEEECFLEEEKEFREKIKTEETIFPTTHSLVFPEETFEQEVASPPPIIFPKEPFPTPRTHVFISAAFERKNEFSNTPLPINEEYFYLLENAEQSFQKIKRDTALTCLDTAQQLHLVLNYLFKNAPQESSFIDQANRYELLLRAAEEALCAKAVNLPSKMKNFEEQEVLKEIEDTYNLMEEIAKNSSYVPSVRDPYYQTQQGAYQIACNRFLEITPPDEVLLKNGKKLARENLLKTIKATLNFLKNQRLLPLNTKKN